MIRTGLPWIAIAVKGGLSGFVLAALMALCVATAVAEPVQQFTVQLKDVRADGRFSVVYTSNAFDTTGEPPPALDDASVRLAKGMAIKPQFLKPDKLCETAKFAGFMYQNQTSKFSYAQMVDDVPRATKFIDKKLTKTARAIVNTCRNAYFGSGTTVVDARPLYPKLIPARFSLFLTTPTAKGAKFGISVISHYDRSSPIAVNEPRYFLLQPIFTLNVFDDPTPDGKYGYRIRLLTEKTSGFRFSIAELNVETKGIVGTTTKRTCAARRGGRCVKFKTRKATEFWADQPRCPASGKLPFKAEYRYITGLRATTVIEAACPRFRR